MTERVIAAILAALNALVKLQVIFDLLLLAVVVMIVLSIYHFHRQREGKYRDFNLIDLIANPDGTINREGFMEMGAFVITSWGFILLVNKAGLTEWYVGIYLAAFGGRAAYSRYLQAKRGDDPGKEGKHGPEAQAS